jgi:hypothetical protein
MLVRLAIVCIVVCACGDNLQVGSSHENGDDVVLADQDSDRDTDENSGEPDTRPPLPIPPVAHPPCSEQAGPDGVVDRVLWYTYDDEGYVTRYTTSWDEMGQYTYDANHFVLQFTHTGGGTSYEETYTRDHDGRVLSYTDDERRITDYVVVAATTNPGGLVQTRTHTEYTPDGQVIADDLAWSDGADDWAYEAHFDTNGAWTGTHLASPSGAYPENEFTETPKETCANVAATEMPFRPLPARTAGRAVPRLWGHPWCAHSYSIGC